MNDPLIVITDADAIVAQTFPDDANHQKAIRISQNLINLNAQVIYPVTAVAEAVTFMQRVLSSGSTAYSTAVSFTNPNVQIVEIDQDIYSYAVRYFSPKTSKKNTLFDCIVAAVAKRYKADAIFSFDHFYKSKGFKLADELKW